MLTFLKRMAGTKNHKKGRIMNIIICSMQISTPIFSLTAFIISLGQQSLLSMIVKDFVTIGFILTIDNLFAGSLPDDVKQIAARINKEGGLRMSRDNNKFSAIKRRWTDGTSSRFNEVLNFLVNIWFYILINFQVIVYNYFAPFAVLIV